MSNPASSNVRTLAPLFTAELVEAQGQSDREYLTTRVRLLVEVVDVYFKDVLLALLHGAGVGTSGGGCPAGIQDFSIAPDGSVYSCHLLYRMPEFRLGNILTDDNLPTEAGLPIRNSEIPECVDCYARNWCQTCGALNLSWGDAWTVPLGGAP